MIAVYANCIVKDENVDKFITLATELIVETRKEEGCESYELIQGVENRSLFAFLEKWKSKEVLNTHINTKHFKIIVPKMGELMDEEMKINVHEVLV